MQLLRGSIQANLCQIGPFRASTAAFTHPLLEDGQVVLGQGISLGDDGDEVNSGTEPLHHLNVERLEGMTRRANKVKASMNPQVHLCFTFRLLFLAHVKLMLIIDEIDNGRP